MTSRDFCYWLQGYFELNHAIRRHLSMVFKHEIDPSAGDTSHQAILNELHGDNGDKKTVLRC